MTDPFDKAIVFSFSKISLYKNCPKAFNYKYFMKKKEAFFSIELHLGRSIHSCLKNAYFQKNDGNEMTLNSLVSSFNEFWNTPDLEKAKVIKQNHLKQNYFDEAISMLENYYNNVFIKDDSEIIEVEKRFYFPLNDSFSIQGVIDKISKQPNGLIRLTDYKTGSQIGKPENSQQLGCYALWAFKEFKVGKIEACIEALKTGETKTTVLMSSIVEETKNQILGDISTICDCNNFVAKPSALCGWCGYNEICDQSASNFQEDSQPEERKVTLPQELKVSKRKKISVKDANEKAVGRKDGEYPLESTGKLNLVDIEITDDFKDVIEEIHSNSPLIFVTGRAGTGKSTLIKYLSHSMPQKIAVVAPTGVAALNAEGQTIHSFFNFPAKAIDLDGIKQLDNRTLYEKLEILIIDEISMVRADLLDGIEKFLRLNSLNPSEPFGGVQIVLVGDLFQLPPIVTNKEEAKIFGGKYLSPYFFSAHGIQEMEMSFIELSKIFRQSDSRFSSILNDIRVGTNLETAIGEINNKCSKEHVENQNLITLTCTNKDASFINEAQLEQLPGEIKTYEGSITGKINIEEERLPAPYLLNLKENAQVMFTKNDNEKRWVNGTVGKIVSLTDEIIKVKIAGEKTTFTHNVQPVSWKSLEYQYNEDKDKIVTKTVGGYRQFPLMPAWAITIHKSQGKTLDKINLELGSGAFAFGQTYVALSRCRSLDDIKLSRNISKRDVLCDEIIVNFYKGVTQ